MALCVYMWSPFTWLWVLFCILATHSGWLLTRCTATSLPCSTSSLLLFLIINPSIFPIAVRRPRRQGRRCWTYPSPWEWQWACPWWSNGSWGGWLGCSTLRMISSWPKARIGRRWFDECCYGVCGWCCSTFRRKGNDQMRHRKQWRNRAGHLEVLLVELRGWTLLIWRRRIEKYQGLAWCTWLWGGSWRGWGSIPRWGWMTPLTPMMMVIMRRRMMAIRGRRPVVCAWLMVASARTMMPAARRLLCMATTASMWPSTTPWIWPSL